MKIVDFVSVSQQLYGASPYQLYNLTRVFVALTSSQTCDVPPDSEIFRCGYQPQGAAFIQTKAPNHTDN